MKYLVVILLAGIAIFGLSGCSQPIVVKVNLPSPCPQCGGSGAVEVSAPCPKCNGSGKGEWFFKSKAKRSDFDHVKPICVACAGKGRIFRREKCPQCQGAGQAAGAAAQKARTVRADWSLWERMLLRAGLQPAANRPPQRSLNGAYPLVEKYIELTFNPAYAARVIKWEAARREGAEWLIKTALEFKDDHGQWRQQAREFIVENREVKGSRAAASSQ